MPISLFVAGYTGVLLAATNVPLWARNYLLMGPTFVTSAFSGALSALTLMLRFFDGEHPETARGLARAETICLAAELGLLLASVRRLGRLGKPLTSGRWGRLFWSGTFVGGVVVTLALHLSGPARGKETAQASRVAAAILALLGGYILRMVMIFAGEDSANRPEDYFEYTRGDRNGHA
jgi:formate-dependent nitrite reductase membrane component NrfD